MLDSLDQMPISTTMETPTIVWHGDVSYNDIIDINAHIANGGRFPSKEILLQGLWAGEGEIRIRESALKPRKRMPYDLDEHNWCLLSLRLEEYSLSVTLAILCRAFTITLKMSLDWAHQVFQQSDPQFFRFLEKFIRNKPCLPVAPLSPSFSITLDLTICDLFSLFREEQIVISFGDPLDDPAPALQIQEVINWLDPSPKELANWRRAMASISVFPIPQRNSPGSREVGALMAIEMSCNPYVTWESYESPLYHRIRFLKVLTTYTEIREDPICKAYFQKKPYVEHPSQIEEMKNYLHSMLRFNGDNATQKCPTPVYIQEKTEVILIEDSESDNDEPPGCSCNASIESTLPNLSDNDEDPSLSCTSHLTSLRSDKLLVVAEDLAAIAATDSELFSITLLGLQQALTLAKQHLELKKQNSIITLAGSTLPTQEGVLSSTILTHSVQEDGPILQLKRCRSSTPDTPKKAVFSAMSAEKSS
ncbi:MAG: hypothetical protein JOS17DRAFT_797122 [Linnemannia elongata]|nr:MAG: hypothetical protein JOS17DRAFT_797122 [Linnemannia elongata]